MRRLFLRKELGHLASEIGAHSPGTEFRRVLRVRDLLLMGVGTTVGAGIFSLTGSAAALYAGPGIVYSFVLGGVLCAFAGLCYAELAAMAPASGSAYAYGYATMGELVAWVVGWDLVLEYAFSAAVVASSWSGYCESLVRTTLGVPVPDVLVRLMRGPWELVTLDDGTQAWGLWNVPATAVTASIVWVLARGVRESASLNALVVAIKLAVISAFVVLGWLVVDPVNWVGDVAASGIGRLVPPHANVLRDGLPTPSFGWPGVLTGAGVVFFAFIGFDALSTTAQECQRPRRDLPAGMLGALAICTALYVLTSLVLTGLVPYQQLGVADPIAVGVDRLVALHGWSRTTGVAFASVMKLGALAGLTSGLLVPMMGQARIFHAMASDGLLPWFDQVHPARRTPVVATVVTGAIVGVAGGIAPMRVVGELVSIGTLLAFLIVCTGVLVLRVTRPEATRPFQTPLPWLVAPMGAAACLWVMSGLPRMTWVRLGVWLAVGFGVYFLYGIRHSRLRARSGAHSVGPPFTVELPCAGPRLPDG